MYMPLYIRVVDSMLSIRPSGNVTNASSDPHLASNAVGSARPSPVNKAKTRSWVGEIALQGTSATGYNDRRRVRLVMDI